MEVEQLSEEVLPPSGSDLTCYTPSVLARHFMATYRNGRKLISITCQPGLYDQVKEICADQDLPVSVWARKVLEREVKKYATPEIV